MGGIERHYIWGGGGSKTNCMPIFEASQAVPSHPSDGSNALIFVTLKGLHYSDILI
jgi:hypothetical protein